VIDAEVVAGQGTRATPTVTLGAPVATLLLVLYRRLPLGTEAVSVDGDRAVLDLWMANSALE